MPIVTNEECESWLDIDSDDFLVPTIRPAVESAIHKYLRWHCVRATYTKFFPKTERGGERAPFNSWGGQPATGGLSRVLMLDHKWVIPSGLVVQEDTTGYMGQNPDADYTTLTLGTEYYLDLDDANVSKTGHLIRIGRTWPKPRGSIKVTYTAGFTTDEFHGDAEINSDADPIRMAALLGVQKAYTQVLTNRPAKAGSTKPSGPLISESVPDYSYRKDSSATLMLASMTVTLPQEAKDKLEPYRRYGIAV